MKMKNESKKPYDPWEYKSPELEAFDPWEAAGGAPEPPRPKLPEPKSPMSTCGCIVGCQVLLATFIYFFIICW